MFDPYLLISQAYKAKPVVARVLSVPFLRNKKFIGRDTILADLQQKLFIEQDCQKLAIVGLGGVGKTQVALQFAYWAREHRPEYAVLWVSALSRASFEQAYLQLGKAFNVPIDDKDEDPMETVRQYLSSVAAGKWLLIVDNADDRELLIESDDIYHYLPESETGVTVFTTRSMDIGISVAGSDIIELHEMDEEEAKKYLEKVIIRKELLRDEEKTAELLRELTYLPLAITQAAAYMNRNRSSIQKYLDLLRSTEEDLVSLMGREFQDNTRYRESQNAVATTWIVSFNQVRKADSTAADILCFIACIEPKAIPRSLLPLPGSGEMNEHAIGTLLAYAFLTIREDEDDEMYDMHSLVHLAIRIWLRKEGLVEEVTMKALSHAAGVFPSDDRRNRKIWQAYLPHTLRLLDRSKIYRVIERFELVFKVGKCFYREHRVSDAINCFEEVSQWRKGCVLDEDDEFLLKSSHWLGRAYRKNSRFKEAIELLEYVAEADRKTLDETDEARIASEHELARAYLSDKRIKKAIEIFERVVEIEKRIHDKNDHERLISEHELARAYLNDSRIKEAIEMFERIVDIQGKTLDETDHYRLTSEHELARAYFSDGRTKEAIGMFERIVEIQRKTLNERDPPRLRSEQLLAHAYLDVGNPSSAIGLLEHVAAIDAEMLPEDHTDRLGSAALLKRAQKMIQSDDWTIV
jgi:tetratricopeptide (TPR) repeat protein